MNLLKDLKTKQSSIKTIAITGGIGTGKSSVCQMLEKAGFKVYYSDLIGHKVLKLTAVKKKLVDHFGTEILKGGEVNRQLLGSIAFRSQKDNQILNSIMHPEIVKIIKAILKQQTQEVTFFEIPLLFEAKLDDLFDFIILVSADTDVRIKRIEKRPGMTQAKANQIISRQMPEKEKAARSDAVIMNNGSLDELKKKLTDFMLFVIGDKGDL